jgi:hypothetical protein
LYVIPIFLCARPIAYLRTTWSTVEKDQRKAVVKNLLESFCNFFHEGGAILKPADYEYYSQFGIPDADRALLRGAQLSVADEKKDEDEDENMDKTSRCEDDDGDINIHGQRCWPPNVEIVGTCSPGWRSIQSAALIELKQGWHGEFHGTCTLARFTG